MDTNNVGRNNFEPREVSSIIDDVMQMISSKRERQNMNKIIENPENSMMKRETATVVHKISGLDLQVGDTVQVKSGDYAGRVGVIIGISLEVGSHGQEFLSYGVKFTDTEGVRFPSGRLRIVRPYDMEE